MKTRIFQCTLGLIFTMAAYASEDRTAEILRSVTKFANAFAAADSDQLAALLTGDYIHTNAGQKAIGRNAWLDYIRTRQNEIRSGRLTIRRYENSELHTVLWKNTAIVTGVNISEGVRDGQSFVSRRRFTQVWVKTSSGWKRKAFHDSPAE